jgi:short subunit dehydrogenase-like uncharacterized protein
LVDEGVARPAEASKAISRGKIEPLAKELGLEVRDFIRGDVAAAVALEGVNLVLHCAGPFSATSAPMIVACLQAIAHYLDITGEISVFEHAMQQDTMARELPCALG